jgi:two-component system chemotaxis sensor kinase CheA
MEKVPAEFLEDAINDLSEISSELRSITFAGDQTLPLLFSKKLFRLLHTIKGSAQTFGLEGEARLAHDTETYLAALKEDPVGGGAAGLLTAALDTLSKNLVLIAEGNAPDPVNQMPERFLRLSPAVGHSDRLPDNFPQEFLNKLSTQEIRGLGLAWDAEKEILILEIRIAQNEFAARFKELRQELDDKADVIAVGSGKGVESAASFRFLIASVRSEALADTVTKFQGKVLFQKKKIAGAEQAPDEAIEGDLAEAIFHGQKAAAMLGKNVKFTTAKELSGIPSQYSKLAPVILLHLVRNAVDHGIEFPLERAILKKPAQGNIEISVNAAEKTFFIRVCDDGRGMDDASQIFKPGFSTAPFVSELSGRGIGLDIVWDAVKKANGSVKVDSKPGHGARFEITLPL